MFIVFYTVKTVYMLVYLWLFHNVSSFCHTYSTMECMYVCMYAYVYVCMHMCVCMYAYVCFFFNYIY